MNVDINGQWSWIKMDFLMGMVVHHVQIVVRGEAFRQMIMEILDVIFAEIDFADMEMVVFA